MATLAPNPSRFTEIANTLAQAQAAVQDQVSTMKRFIRDRDPMSTKFVGFVRDYRYTAGRKGEMPSHRFYLECGRGVWLYARVPSDNFERVMADMEIDFSQGSLDGRMLVCTGDSSVNALVPLEFVNPFEPLIADRFGNVLFEGAPVTCMTGDQLVSGKVDAYVDGLVRVSPDNGDDVVEFTTPNVIRQF